MNIISFVEFLFFINMKVMLLKHLRVTGLEVPGLQWNQVNIKKGDSFQGINTFHEATFMENSAGLTENCKLLDGLN